MQNQRLQYERIIITGASSGFGKAFARTLASCTGELVLVARNEEALQQLAAELEEKHPGLRAAALPCDLADESALDNLAGRLLELPAAKTLLINNAGAGDYGEFSEGSWDRIRTLLRLNVESLTRLCHAMIPGLKRNGGDIINISSLAALLPHPGLCRLCGHQGIRFQPVGSPAAGTEGTRHTSPGRLPRPRLHGIRESGAPPRLHRQHDAGQKRL